MDRQAAKVYLTQYRRALERERQVAEEIARIEEQATSTTARLTGTPNTQTPGDKVGNGGARVADKRRLLDEIRTESEGLREEIFLTINEVKDRARAELLHRHYIGGQGFADIAEAMHYSDRWVIEIHKRALDDIAEILARLH